MGEVEDRRGEMMQLYKIKNKNVTSRMVISSRFSVRSGKLF